MKRTPQSDDLAPPPSKRLKKNETQQFITRITDGSEDDEYVLMEIIDLTKPNMSVSQVFLGRSKLLKQPNGVVIGRSDFEDPNFGVFNQVNVIRLSREHFCVQLSHIAGQERLIFKRLSANLLAYENVILEKNEPVQVDDGAVVFLLLNKQDPSVPDVQATFKIIRHQKKPATAKTPPKETSRSAPAAPSEQSQMMLEFWESTQMLKEALVDPKKVSSSVGFNEDATDGFDSSTEYAAAEPIPKKKKVKKLVPQSPAKSNKLQPIPPQDGSVHYVPRSPQRAMEKSSNHAKSTIRTMENLCVCFLGFSDVADLSEQRPNIRDDAAQAARIATSLKKLKSKVIVSQYTVLESQLLHVDVVCIHDQAFTLRDEYNRYFLALRRNPRVEFVSPSYLRNCVTQSRILDLDTSDDLDRSRILSSNLMYLLLDMSALEHLSEYKKQLDSLGEDQCQYFKLKSACSSDEIAKLSSPAKGVVESLMKKKQLLEYTDVYELLPSDLNVIVRRALTLLWNYRTRCRDVVIVSDSEIIKRQAAAWQIEVVDRASFPLLLQQHGQFVSQRQKLLDLPTALWDANGAVKHQ